MIHREAEVKSNSSHLLRPVTEQVLWNPRYTLGISLVGCRINNRASSARKEKEIQDWLYTLPKIKSSKGSRKRRDIDARYLWTNQTPVKLLDLTTLRKIHIRERSLPSKVSLSLVNITSMLVDMFQTCLQVYTNTSQRNYFDTYYLF
jgi:hypothetical protein